MLYKAQDLLGSSELEYSLRYIIPILRALLTVLSENEHITIIIRGDSAWPAIGQYTSEWVT